MMRSKLQRHTLALVTALAATPAAATSWSVTVDGQSYDLVVVDTEVEGQPEYGPDRMPWWGSLDDALAFAEATWAETGIPDIDFAYATGDPFYSFAFTIDDAESFPDGAGTGITFPSNLETVAVLAPPAEVPEIDGSALAQLTLVLGAGWLMTAARRRDGDGAA